MTEEPVSFGEIAPQGSEFDQTFAMRTGATVRRLTPVECERLQGFPDGWTCMCESDPCRCSDGPRYRAMGNAVSVPVIEWIGRRMMAVDAIEEQGEPW